MYAKYTPVVGFSILRRLASKLTRFVLGNYFGAIQIKTQKQAYGLLFLMRNGFVSLRFTRKDLENDE